MIAKRKEQKLVDKPKQKLAKLKNMLDYVKKKTPNAKQKAATAAKSAKLKSNLN